MESIKNKANITDGSPADLLLEDLRRYKRTSTYATYVLHHAIIFARSVLEPFDVASEGSKVGVGKKDVGMLA